MGENEKTYQIGENTYRIGVLTLGDVENLLACFDESQIDYANLNAAQIFRELLKNKTIDKFFAIVLKGENPLNSKILPVDLAVEVVSDFLASSQISKTLSMFFSMAGNFSQRIEQLVSTLEK